MAIEISTEAQRLRDNRLMNSKAQIAQFPLADSFTEFLGLLREYEPA